jgi:hypothetical protein
VWIDSRGGKFENFFVNCDLIKDTKSAFIKLGTCKCIISVLIACNIIAVFSVECNLSFNLKKLIFGHVFI